MKQTLSFIDVLNVKADQIEAADAVKSFDLPEFVESIECDILIVGGGTAGVAAALAAAKEKDLKICLTEETDWLGGQMTSQGVPITDDGKNFQVETSGANRTYQLLRQKIRDYYKQTYKLASTSLEAKYFNPGNCWYWVSQLAFEPKAAITALHDLLYSRENESIPEIYLRQITAKVEIADNQIQKVLTVNLDTGRWLAFKAKSYIDATELGELLVLSGAEYNSGTESKAQTGEMHAAETANVEHVQDYVFPFIVEFVPNSNNTIAKPALYEHFHKQGKFSLLRYKMFDHGNKINDDGVIISELMPFWTYRRIVDKSAFADQRINYDLSVINWFSNDFRDHNIIDKSPLIVSEYLSLAKSCSLSFLYWLQTEAPRDDGGKGYPELRLKVDALGTEDGLSKFPYIRESRRGKAFTIIKEEDIVNDSPKIARAKLFEDSVGIGFFPIDIHGKEAPAGALNPTKHFQIPLGAMLISFPTNLILSCKNIGTTHITNAAYRLHSIDWATGEAAGYLACFALEQKKSLYDILHNANTLWQFQLQLLRSGVPLYWYDDVPTDHPDFEAIQSLSLQNIMNSYPHHLHFYPEAPISSEEAATIISQVAHRFNTKLGNVTPPDSVKTRGNLARWLYDQLLQTPLVSYASTKAKSISNS